MGLFVLLPGHSDEQHLQNVDVQQKEELHRRQAAVFDVDGGLVLAGGLRHRGPFGLQSARTSHNPTLIHAQSNLGQTARIKQTWGIGLPTICFGAGFVLYFDLVIFIFGKLHENRGMKGSPAMFLLIAPPSVAVVSLDMMDEDADAFPDSAEMMLGWALVLLVLLFRLGPSEYDN